MRKFIDIHCNEKMKDIICMALREFAYLAYPKTENSECNLVAADALLNAADDFENTFSKSGKGILNRRLRMMVKTAIEAHYDIIANLEKCQTKNQCEVMLKVCRGELVDAQLLIEAEQLDQPRKIS